MLPPPNLFCSFITSSGSGEATTISLAKQFILMRTRQQYKGHGVRCRRPPTWHTMRGVKQAGIVEAQDVKVMGEKRKGGEV